MKPQPSFMCFSHLGTSHTWTLVGMALAHHDAAEGNERGRGEAKLLGTQEGSNRHITSSAELAVNLKMKATGGEVSHQSGRMIWRMKVQKPLAI